MGRCSSPLMTTKPKKTVRRKSACTRTGARTHHACCACGRLRANPRQLQLPRKPLLARQLEAAAMPSKSAAAVLITSAAAVLMEKRAGMPLEAAGDDDEATEAVLALPPASRLKRRQPTSRQRSRPRRQRGRHPCWWWAGRPSETLRTPLGMLVAVSRRCRPHPPAALLRKAPS